MSEQQKPLTAEDIAKAWGITLDMANELIREANAIKEKLRAARRERFHKRKDAMANK